LFLGHGGASSVFWLDAFFVPSDGAIASETAAPFSARPKACKLVRYQESTMQTIELGRSGIFVPPVIFGCNVFGWTLDKAQSFRILDELVERGLNALDTADAMPIGCRATKAASPRPSWANG
jgi:hypothetical protein